MAQVIFTERVSDPTTPAAGKVSLYAKDDILYIKDEAGVVTSLVNTVPALHGGTHTAGQPDEFSLAGMSGLLLTPQKSLPGFSGYVTSNNEIPAGGMLTGISVERFVHDGGVYIWSLGNAVTINETGRYEVKVHFHCQIIAAQPAGTRRVEFGLAVDGELLTTLAGIIDVEGSGFTPGNGSAVIGEIDLTAAQTLDIFASRLTGVGIVEIFPDLCGISIRRVS